jgi:hypothetical protein
MIVFLWIIEDYEHFIGTEAIRHIEARPKLLKSIPEGGNFLVSPAASTPMGRTYEYRDS